MVSTAVGVKVGASVAVGGMCVSVGSAVSLCSSPPPSGGDAVGSVVTEGPGPQQVTEVTVKSNAMIVRHLISFLFLLGKVS
jgi:hypothetical protein